MTAIPNKDMMKDWEQTLSESASASTLASGLLMENLGFKVTALKDLTLDGQQIPALSELDVISASKANGKEYYHVKVGQKVFLLDRETEASILSWSAKRELKRKVENERPDHYGDW